MANLGIESEVYREKQVLLSWLKRFGSRLKTGFIITDPFTEDDSVVFVNDSFTVITGYRTEDILGKNLSLLFGEATDLKLVSKIDGWLRKGEPVNQELLYYKKEGRPFWSELSIQPLVDNRGEVIFNISLMRDVTDQRKDELLLKLQERILAGINEGIALEEIMQRVFEVAESFLLTDADYLSAFKEKSGHWSVQASESIPETVIKKMRMKLAGEEPNLDNKKIYVTEINENSTYDYQISWSVPLFDAQGKFNGLFILFKNNLDVPTQIQQQFLEELTPVLQMTTTFFEQQSRLHELAFTDPATGLPNSHAFIEKITRDFNKEKNYFVAIVQPSEYAKIIDIHGRDAGDALFVQLARRIEKEEISRGGFIARFSSASLIIFNEINDRTIVDGHSVKQKEIVSEPFIIAGEEMLLTMKTGIALYMKEDMSVKELIRRADIALTDASRRPGHSTSYYVDVQNEEIVQEMMIFNELTKALVAEEIEVHLQPKVNLKSREIIGFEALARWHSPVLGKVSPDDFISVAEGIGKIIELEEIVLRKVLKWQSKRVATGKKMYQIAVNISLDHFFHVSFFATLKSLCQEYLVNPIHIRLEIIESIGLVDFEKAKEIFELLRAEGFDVSIDDFGVGYSSLSYLPQLNVDELKIDRSFIKDLDEPGTYAVVMTIIQLAQNLDLSIVAEGIEEEEQIGKLLLLGCHIGQGFYFYRPMPLNDIDTLLEQ